MSEIGSKIEESKLLEEAMQKGKSLGIETIDGKRYLTGYRLTKSYPLNISFRSDYEMIMIDWEEKQSFIINVLSSLVFFSIVLVFVLLYRYITEKELEIELHKNELKSRKRYQILFEESTNFVVIMDSEGEIKKINNKALRFLNLKHQEYLSKKLYELRSWDEDSQRWIKEMVLNFKSSELVKKELIVFDSDKKKKIVEFTLSYIEVDGNFELFGSWIDITETKYYEEEILRAKEMAERSSRAKSDFLANMSHEIRTPLNGIIGLTELVLKTELKEIQREYLQKAQTSSYALLYVINDILDYSKIESGKLDLENIPFELNKVKESLIDLFEYQANKKGITLRVNSPKNMRLVGDALRLRQILTNLIGNAIKFTDNGSIVVNIEILNEKDKDVKLLFRVKDSGIGMSQKVKRSVFMEFNQADNSITRQYGGTGLGLAIVKQLVHLMGGEIWVESKQGEGSEFSFTLTFTTDDNPSEVEDAKEVDLKSIEMIRGAKILLVEDNKINQVVALGMINDLDIDVEIAQNGKEAVDMARTREYDLILMDLQMPIMDGFESAREIRTFNKEIPIVALSAAVLQEDIDKTKESGMDRHLAKPIDQRELVEVFAKFIKVKNKKRVTPKKEKEIFKGEELLDYYGVDLDELRARVGDNKRVIEKILNSFCRDYEEMDEIFDLNEIESESFSKAIHTLKGVSGNLSLKEIFTLSQEIYATKDLDRKHSLTRELLALMRETIESLKKQLSSSVEKTQERRYSKDEVALFIEELREDLSHYRVISNSRVDSALQMLKEHMQKDEVSKLKAYLHDYKYREAYELILKFDRESK